MKEISIASVLIVQNGRFLFIKAKVGSAKGLWNNPGGHLGDGESLEDGAKREALEETGYEVRLGHLIGTFLWERKGKMIVKRVYEATIVGGSLNLPEDEIAEARWFSLDEVNGGGFTSGAMISAKDFSKGKFNQRYVCKTVH